MQPLTVRTLEGTWGTVLLPVNEDDSIDWSALAADLDYLIDSGLDGCYFNGTAGEFHTQSEAEFDRLAETVATRCEAANQPFQVGASHPNAQTTLERVQRTRSLAPGAFQVILPDWSPCTNDEAIAFLDRICDAAGGIPLVLYNPPNAKRILEPEDFTVIIDRVPGVIGIKVKGEDEVWFRAMQPVSNRIAMFTAGTLLATGVSRGSKGAYSNAACLQPAGAAAWYRTMLTDPDAARATEIRIAGFWNEHLGPIRQAATYSSPAWDKLLAAIGGWTSKGAAGTRVRWPYRSHDPALAERLAPVAREAIPEFFS